MANSYLIYQVIQNVDQCAQKEPEVKLFINAKEVFNCKNKQKRRFMIAKIGRKLKIIAGK